MKQFYVYIQCDPDTKTPRYIGKGHGRRYCSLGRRNKAHIAWMKSYGHPKNLHIIIYNTETEQAAFALEIKLIYWLRDVLGYFLFNQTGGGEGPIGFKHSAETKKIIGLANTGKMVSIETRELQRQIQTGKKRSEQIKQGIRASHQTPEYRDKQSKAKKGKNPRGFGWKHSAETRKKQSLAQKGRKMPESWISPNKGVPKTLEHRENLSRSRKKLFVNRRVHKLIEIYLSQDTTYYSRPLSKVSRSQGAL